MGKPKIAVLMGGRSLEREISLHSGRRVSGALQDLGYRVLDVDVDEGLVSLLKRERPDLAFVALSAGTLREMGAAGAFPEIIRDLGIPLVVKPAAQGSALGIKIVRAREELAPALLAALSYD